MPRTLTQDDAYLAAARVGRDEERAEADNRRGRPPLVYVGEADVATPRHGRHPANVAHVGLYFETNSQGGANCNRPWYHSASDTWAKGYSDDAYPEARSDGERFTLPTARHAQARAALPEVEDSAPVEPLEVDEDKRREIIGGVQAASRMVTAAATAAAAQLNPRR